MTAVAALALGGLMTSCTKDTDLSGGTARSSQDVQKTYEEAFLNTFGRPVEGLDWGFGIANNSTVANTRAMTRANSIGELTDVDKTMPAQPTFSEEITMPTQYKNTLAEAKKIPDIAPLTSNYTSGGTYYVEAKNWDNNNPKAVDIQSNPLTIYFDGDIVFYGNNEQNSKTTFCVTEDSKLTLQKVRNGLTVYLAPRATLDLTQQKNDEGKQLATFQNDNSAIYVNRGSTVKAIDLSLVGGTKVRNEGYIEVENLSINGQNQDNSTLWNEGEVKVNETLTLYNQNGEFINRNKLTAKALDMSSGGKFNNWSKTTITGASYITNTNSWWENDGEYTTGTFEVKNAKRVWNNCRLTAKTNFHIHTEGQFVLNGGQGYGASVVCENTFTFGDDADFWLGHKSLVSVANDLTVDHQDKGHGFRGPRSGDYAVITAANIKKSINPDYSMSYYGNLFIDTGSHFPQGETNAHPCWVYEDNVKFSFMGDNFSVTIDADEKGCNPGYKKDTDDDDDDEDEDPDPEAVMVVAEDLSTYIGSDGKELADFDFNDVIFEVRKGSNNVHIKLRAAGGTLPLTVGGAEGWTVDNHGEQVLAYEVHRLFKVSTGTMVNTNSTTNGATRDPVEFDIDYPEGVSPSNNIYEIANAIPIRVYREDLSSDTNEKKWIVIPKAQPVTSDSGSTITASKLCVDTDFRWCNERNHIDTKFHYIDSYGNNKGSRFRLYLNGELRGKWWKDDTRISGDN